MIPMLIAIAICSFLGAAALVIRQYFINRHKEREDRQMANHLQETYGGN